MLPAFGREVPLPQHLPGNRARRAKFRTYATQPRGASFHQILSLQSPATVQSGSLWRNPCIGDTLAGNYRVGPDYNVGYSPQDSHPGEQSQSQHGYDSHHHHRGNPLQHAGSGSLHEQTPPQSHHSMSQHHHPSHHHQILMDPSQHMGGLPAARHLGHPGPSHYGAPGPSHGLPLYPSMTPPQPHGGGAKRSRPDDLDLSVSGMPELDQNLESMQQTPMGAAYAQAAGAAPTHHHHRLPDQGPPSKMMRREGDGSLPGSGGGAPSVVGQVGMPSPAPRPRGPKLKFTPEDDQLLIDLKENKSLTWKQIADFFPGRSSGTLQVRYCTKLKAKTTQWTDETDQKLRTALNDYENEKWRIVANKVGTGFTPIACRERAQQLMGASPPGISAPGSGDTIFPRHF
ncbi:uncharacterized protein BCR38DRAFT_455410 [Pseudomassariella vexata]|uniref:Uncharacterized protein n=1 Tax=Pseudomassariella vexata TaxID=1141098 RepID=A0A1Y2EA22_9PEZI|nr:uncharacterized protein BCR38DRAFT_455410 [Pseudomassariella vexata]ORY68423.1 hypothetical protein BCR38DRAFT_455410 [Pseudomassariella vexata]